MGDNLGPNISPAGSGIHATSHANCLSVFEWYHFASKLCVARAHRRLRKMPVPSDELPHTLSGPAWPYCEPARHVFASDEGSCRFQKQSRKKLGSNTSCLVALTICSRELGPPAIQGGKGRATLGAIVSARHAVRIWRRTALPFCIHGKGAQA